MSNLEDSGDIKDDSGSVEGHIARNLFRTDSDSDSGSDCGGDETFNNPPQHPLPLEDANEQSVSEKSTSEIRRYMHVLIEQKTVRGSIAEKLWPAAMHLASFVLDNVRSGSFADDSQNRAVLLRVHQLLNLAPNLSAIELGAGVGLTGLELATQLRCKLLLTDLPSGLPLLRRNIELNRESFMLGPDAVNAQALEWGLDEQSLEALKWCQERALSAKQPILLLGSDCVYWEELQAPLERTLFSLLSQAPAGSLCLLAGMRRWKRDNAFYQSLGKRTRTDTNTLQCTCLHESVSRANGDRNVMRVYAVEYVTRQRAKPLTRIATH